MPEVQLQLRGESQAELSGVVTVDNVVQVQVTGYGLIDQSLEKLQINLSQVEARGSAIIALLISWQRYGLQHNKKLEFVSPPPNLMAIAEASGVESILVFAKTP